MTIGMRAAEWFFGYMERQGVTILTNERYADLLKSWDDTISTAKEIERLQDAANERGDMVAYDLCSDWYMLVTIGRIPAMNGASK